jgi:hypothetical protein
MYPGEKMLLTMNYQPNKNDAQAQLITGGSERVHYLHARTEEGNGAALPPQRRSYRSRLVTNFRAKGRITWVLVEMFPSA